MTTEDKLARAASAFSNTGSAFARLGRAAIQASKAFDVFVVAWRARANGGAR